MNTLKDYVDLRLTHADKFAEAEAYPLTLKDCKKYKKMKQLEIYGNSVQDGTPTPEAPVDVVSVGELVTDEADANYGKYKIPIVQRGINLFSMAKCHTNEPTEKNGVTVTDLSDERIYVKGTPTANTNYYFYKTGSVASMPIKAGVYRAKAHSKLYALGFALYKDGSFYKNIFAGSSIKVDEDCYIFNCLIIFEAGVEYDDIIELQLVEGTEDLPYEPYVEPVTTNVFINEPLGSGEYIDFKNKKVVRGISNEVIECRLPTLISKTSIIEVDTSLLPSGAYGKYIKK